jgi:phage terminase large subunit-like protein
MRQSQKRQSILPKSTSTDPVARYAREVIDGRIIAGPLVRLACERHLRDLAEQAKRGLVWRADRAQYAIGFFRDVLRLNGGEHEGKPFELTLWQQFIVGSLFGWYGDDGFRRFRVAYVEIGKGNGKSPMAAGIGLLMMEADSEPRAEIYAAAVDKDQAAILFRDAVAMVDQSPMLNARITRSGGTGKEWNLADMKTGSFYRPISSEHKGRGKSGPRPHCALLDEVHEHPTNAMVEFMRAGTKGRRQALIFMITNSGFDRSTVCWHYHEYAERVLKGLFEDDAFFGFVCGLDEGDDWKDELVWLKANPNLDVSITRKYLREQVREATGMPSKQSIVRRLNFCEWVGAENPWIDEAAWFACEITTDRAALKGKPAYAGLDLSGKNDLTAMVVIFPEESKKTAIPYFWAPAEGIKDREDRDRVPYTLWRDQGHLQATPGRSIDYAFAAMKVKELMEFCDLKELAFDRWRMDDFERELHALGIQTERVDFGKEPVSNTALILRPHWQGFKDMGPAVDTLETDVLNGTLKVEKNPVMTMCSLNAVLTLDPAGSRKFDKRAGKSTGRIDGIVALTMAERCAALAAITGPSVYESRGLLQL